MYALVVCEKPDAARRIAYALGTPRESKPEGVPIFEVNSDGRKYVICSALGHLYGLADATAHRSVYPVLDLEWSPDPKNSRAARVIKIISALAKEASSFVHACDYDQEGEVIGHSILEYACGGKYAKSMRAKFSTLTEEEIRGSFTNLAAPSSGLAEAGRSRHMLDFLYGVNLSRAIARSFKAASGGYRNLSIGRVQGPTLAFAVDREFEIRLHVPVPHWTVDALFSRQGQKFSAHYINPKISTLLEAKKIVDACLGVEGTTDNIVSTRVVLRPPTPFNIGDLQREAYRLFRTSPGYTLAIAEKLYLQALISYPRTSSQKLPPSIGYAKIISGISKIGAYGRLAFMLLSKSNLRPSEGKMTDSAHPAIYPTGVAPRRRLGGLEFKIYDLIVKRFLATFGDAAASQRTQVSIGVGSYEFRADGNAPLYEGWTVFYEPYIRLEECPLPELHKGDAVENLGIQMQEKFTQPPRKYNQASLLAKMELEQIGTKATRADVIATLFKRNYVASARDGIRVTDLGFAVIESMKSFVPEIISTDLTRVMESQLQNVEQGFGDSTSAIENAVDRLIGSLGIFIENEAEIGGRIGNAAAEDWRQAATIGQCPVCGTGQLRIIRSRATKKRFVGCSNYAAAECRATAPLPQRGSIRTTGKACGECGWPIIGVLFARRAKLWRTCINSKCPSKNRVTANQ
ncbi:MAG TPA: DNA topoisomerase I [Nitrososphaera sp.]|nr:DNA topoisomerase I [Nitrososphaera sp.]